jgi:hypothetical protein
MFYGRELKTEFVVGEKSSLARSLSVFYVFAAIIIRREVDCVPCFRSVFYYVYDKQQRRRSGDFGERIYFYGLFIVARGSGTSEIRTRITPRN